MTSPEDQGLEDALRRALSEVAAGVEPSGDGLDKIRARIGDRPPRPWLLSVVLGVAGRVRNFTWRGHWAWPAWLSRLPEVRWPRPRRGGSHRRDTGSLRPAAFLAAVLAAVAVIASLTLGVQPFRDAILQSSTAPQGGNGPQQAAARTEGKGARTISASAAVTPSPGSTAAGIGRSGLGGNSGASGKSGTGKPHTRAPAKKAPTPSATPAASSPPGPTPTPTPAAAPTPTPTATPTPTGTEPTPSPTQTGDPSMPGNGCASPSASPHWPRPDRRSRGWHWDGGWW